MASNQTPPPVTQTPTPTLAKIKEQLRLGKDTIPRPAPGYEYSDEYRRKVRVDENFQRLRLHGFTIKELHIAGCYGNKDDKPSNLPQIIHPLFGLSHWESDDGLIEDIGKGYPGKWNIYTNQIVKDAMLPILYLATQILRTITPWPWFDALYMGERRLVPAADCPDGCKPTDNNYNVKSFHVRPRNQGPSVSQTAHDLKHRDIPKIHWSDLRFQIRSCIAKQASMAPAHRGLFWGFTNPHPKNTPSYFKGSWIDISSEGVMPLLRSDLHPSERLAQQFVVAKTLCHEVMHMLGYYTRTLHQTPPFEWGEPFFEDEAQTELGTSWETNTFGGRLAYMHTKKKETFDQLALGIMVEDWPSFSSFKNGQVRFPVCRYRNHNLFNAPAFVTRWPIPGVYVETIQQASFWNTDAIKYGPVSLFPPRVIGKVFDNTTERGNPLWILPDLHTPRPTTGLTPFQIEAEKARYNSILKAQVAAHDVAVHLRFEAFSKKRKRHHPVNSWEQTEKDLEQASIDGAKKKLSKPECKDSIYDIFDALRESNFPYIRIQANYYLGIWGVWGLLGSKRLPLKKRVYLLQCASTESVLLARDHLNDADVIKLDKMVQQARAAVKVEQQQQQRHAPPPPTT